MLRDLLVSCLHRVLKDHYENLIVLKPGITYKEIFGDLERRFQVDNP